MIVHEVYIMMPSGCKVQKVVKLLDLCYPLVDVDELSVYSKIGFSDSFLLHVIVFLQLHRVMPELWISCGDVSAPPLSQFSLLQFTNRSD